MTSMGWQKHTVRGCIAGALKKAGYHVESFKPQGGERTYRIPSQAVAADFRWPARLRLRRALSFRISVS